MEFAKNATLMFSPGQYFPSEIVPTASSIAPTMTVTSTSTATAPSSTQAASSSRPLSTGAIVGIAVGGAIIALLLAILSYLCGRQRTMGELLHSQPPSRASSDLPADRSITSTTSSVPPNIPQFDFNAAAPRRYSINTLFAGIESNRRQSRIPPMEQTMEKGILFPSSYVAGAPENMSPEGRKSPFRRISSKRPLKLSSNPTSPMGESMYVPLQMDFSPVAPTPVLR